MILGGLWHGAAINFIVWGTLHGLYLVLHKSLKIIFPKQSQNFFFKTKLGKIISISITQYFILLAWIPFRLQEIDGMFYSMSKFIIVDFQILEVIEFILGHKFNVLILVLFIIIHFISFRNRNIVEKISKFNLKTWFIVIIIITTSIIFFYNGNPEDFIYFRF
jgi:D-alanyl-lipoteichoic acid acyltransferase DltB (MBOAT superfamily)